ncbi:MAG: thiamine phosphate synthase [Paracoccaceae bacterium]
MAMEDRPQIYLLTPPEIDLSNFPGTLAQVLDTHDIACLRLNLATRDVDQITRAADVIRELAHARDVALVIQEHVGLVETLGLDGIHLTDGARSVRKTREALGADAIVGTFAAASKHDGMTAGETGADYVAFGPVGTSALGDGTRAEHALFEWWSEAIEVPIVAEGDLSEDVIATLAPVTDFFAIGEEIWRHDDPSAALGQLIAAMG